MKLEMERRLKTTVAELVVRPDVVKPSTTPVPETPEWKPRFTDRDFKESRPFVRVALGCTAVIMILFFWGLGHLPS